ncbi:hypothetical protein [Moritella dasanensis]|uniref:hypothetical protein n=1 Tax=Moritella dasanensis TaxID=428031 RepID=UPI00030001D5|nr:hypothetical protein [Moritella dasanensis]
MFNTIGTILIILFVIVYLKTDLIQQLTAFTASFSVAQHMLAGVILCVGRLIFGFLTAIYSSVLGEYTWADGINIFILSWYDSVVIAIKFWVLMFVLFIFRIGTL